MSLLTVFVIFTIIALIAAFGALLNKSARRMAAKFWTPMKNLTLPEKLALYGIPGGGSTNPPTNEDDAIAALQATDADEDTTAGLLVTAYTNQVSQVSSLTAQLATAIAANDPTKTAARLAQLQQLNTQNATTAANMKTALAAPPTP